MAESSLATMDSEATASLTSSDEESSPLLSNNNRGAVYVVNVREASSLSDEQERPRHCSDSSVHEGGATYGGTVLNLMKTCMGTGFLALPFACQQAGLLLNCFGLLAIALWNAVSVQRLCLCLNYLPPEPRQCAPDALKAPASQYQDYVYYHADCQEAHHDYMPGDWELGVDIHSGTTMQQRPLQPLPPPDGTSTLGRVAWYALGGPLGLHIVDAMIFLLLLGVVVSYIVAAVCFLADTPFTLGSTLLDTVVAVVIICSLSMVRNVGRLARLSACGLAILAMTFLVLVWYGFAGSEPPEGSVDLFSFASLLEVVANSKTVPLWPESFAGICHWFGISVFGFGIVPLTFNFRESMAQPNRMVTASVVALLLVFGGYMVIGVGLLIAYPNLQGDVLHELPKDGLLPVITRLAMVWVALVTAPLLGIPCAELVQGKICPNGRTSFSSDAQEGDGGSRRHRLQTLLIRFGVVALAGVIARGFPGFVQILSLVGCACVATVGFILPPLFHLRLARRQSQWWMDVTLLVLGTVAAVTSTWITLQESSSSR